MVVVVGGLVVVVGLAVVAVVDDGVCLAAGATVVGGVVGSVVAGGIDGGIANWAKPGCAAPLMRLNSPPTKT